MSDPSRSHSYGTRIKNNSVLKPSARLRHTPPPPRRIKPARHPSHPPTTTPHATHYPVFPLPNVMLHPEDAASKVFHAIGRCFLSVDNRAMTIKDLAEMTLKFGLMCQNVSAASQAITTYIRNHLARCEAQQDHPLLLRHVLSGTPADDDLVPALHSRVGGAPLQRQPTPTETTVNIPPGRHTNFRRGTIVWYLSKASGVSCPFARASILLSNYSSTPASNPKPRTKENCGEKRKRLITRHCRQSPSPAPSSSPVDSGYAESPSASSEDDDDDEQGERPPKVKLTLRLRASPACAAPTTTPDIIDLSNDTSSSSSDEDDEEEEDVDMSPEVTLTPEPLPFCLPPYPRRSIAVPCYTPVSPPTRTSGLQYVFPQPPIDSASPPPDSEHEEDGEFDFDFSSDEEESRGVSVGVKVEDMDEEMGLGLGGGCGIGSAGVGVKAKNVRDMLEAWEDLDLDRARSYSNPCLDSSSSSLPSSSSLVQREEVRLPTPASEVKAEDLEMWEWEFESGWAGGEVEVKKEGSVDSSSSLLPSSRDLSLSPMRALPSSPMSPLTNTSSPCSSIGGFSPPLSYSIGVFPSTPPLPPRVTSLADSPTRAPWTATHMKKPSLERKDSVLNWQDAELLGPDSVHITELEMELEWAGRKRFISSPVPVEAASPATSSASSEDAEMADPERNEQEQTHEEEEEEVVVVHTCVPCEPPVSATQVEGIPVYQTTLPHANTTRVLLRRLDTDFVNLTPLLAVFCSALSCPMLHPSSTHVTHPNPSVSGTWAPLSTARHFLSQCPATPMRASVEVFLSDELVMRFPSALRDFWRVSKPGRMLGQFGVCFGGGVVRPCSGPVIRHQASTSCSPPPPSVSTREVSSPVQSPPKSISPSSSRSESHSPPSAEMHPSTLPSRLMASSSPLCRSSDALPSTSKTYHRDSWILCEELNSEPELEPVLPAFDMLAELASGLGPNLGVLNMNMNAIGLSGPASISGGGGGDAESPLSPTEAEMFRVLCVCPDWEEKEEEEEEEEGVSPDSGMNPTVVPCGHDTDPDPDVDIDVDGDGDVDVDIDVEAVEEEPRSLKDGRSLRRSKRVADAAARTTRAVRRTRGPRHA